MQIRAMRAIAHPASQMHTLRISVVVLEDVRQHCLYLLPRHLGATVLVS